MKHEIGLRQLSEYMDGACSSSDKVRIESHLAVCASCRKALEEMRTCDTAVKEFGREHADTAFDAAFRVKLERELRMKEERWLDGVLGDIMRKASSVLMPPAPVFVGAVAALFLAVVTYGVLDNITEAPEIGSAGTGVYISVAKTGRTEAAREGFRLAKGDTVDVAEGSFADIKQPGGKFTVRLKSGARMRLAKALPKYIRGTVSLDVEKGKALIIVNKNFMESRFLVHTPEAQATVTGTSFIVNVSIGPKPFTQLGVLEGSVNIMSIFRPKEAFAAQNVTVAGGEMTEVKKGEVPSTPRQLLDSEWAEMAEFYKIGKKARVALLVSDGKNRVKELLRPCPIYISDVEPRTLSESLEETIRIIDEAIKTKDTAKHLEGIRRLEDVLAKYPNSDYEPQLALFIGSYYNYLGRPEDAIRSFRKVLDKYAGSSFASMAAYATGVVFETKLNDKDSARYYYVLLIQKYGDMPEAKNAKAKLGRK